MDQTGSEEDRERPLRGLKSGVIGIGEIGGIEFRKLRLRRRVFDGHDPDVDRAGAPLGLPAADHRTGRNTERRQASEELARGGRREDKVTFQDYYHVPLTSVCA